MIQETKFIAGPLTLPYMGGWGGGGEEGKTSKDCPIAKWILQRPGLHEKYLVVLKE